MRQRTHRWFSAAVCFLTALLPCAAGCHSAASGRASPASTRALSLQHGTLINPGARPIPNATVTVSGDRITCAGNTTACPEPGGATVVDVSGNYIGPGLIDSHVHYSQTGWVDGRPDAIDLRAKYPYDSVVRSLETHAERFHRADLCSGVTSAFDVGGFPWTYGLARQTRRATDAPRVVAVGPLLSTIAVDSQMMGQFVFMSDETVVRSAIRQHRDAGAEAIKVWYIQVPDSLHDHAKAMLMAAGNETHKAGLRLVVHATELPNAKEALEAGADVLVHDVSEGAVDDEFLHAARRNGTIVIPTLTVFEGYADVFLGRSPGLRYPLDCVDPVTRNKLEGSVTDTARAAAKAFWNGPIPASLMRTAMANLRRMYQAGIPIAMGTDAGNPGTAHGPSVYREMELMQKAGMPAAAVFSSATIVAAKAIGLEREVGSITPGKRADLVVFEADPTRDIHNARRVRYVVRNGVLRSRRDLLPR